MHAINEWGYLHAGTRHQFGEPGLPGPVTLQIYENVTGIQTQQLPDPHGWVYVV